MKTLEKVIKNKAFMLSSIKELNEHDQYDHFKLILEIMDIDYIHHHTRVFYRKLPSASLLFFSRRAKEQNPYEVLLVIKIKIFVDGGDLEVTFYERYEDFYDDLDRLHTQILGNIKYEKEHRDIFTFTKPFTAIIEMVFMENTPRYWQVSEDEEDDETEEEETEELTNSLPDHNFTGSGSVLDRLLNPKEEQIINTGKKF